MGSVPQRLRLDGAGIMNLEIGIMPEPTRRPDWAAMSAYLEPAAKLGARGVIMPLEEVWTVHRDGELLAACVARLTVDRIGEIVLCGGRDPREWASKLADAICRWFREEGMILARIYGRKGWGRLLKDWRVMGCMDGATVFERVL